MGDSECDASLESRGLFARPMPMEVLAPAQRSVERRATRLSLWFTSRAYEAVRRWLTGRAPEMVSLPIVVANAARQSFRRQSPTNADSVKFRRLCAPGKCGKVVDQTAISPKSDVSLPTALINPARQSFALSLQPSSIHYHRHTFPLRHD